MSGSRTGLGLVGAFGVGSAIGTLLAGVWAGLPGAVLAVAGVYRRSRRLLGLGVLVLFGGVLVAGLLGAPVWLLVPATAATVLTWDVGENAIGVAEQFPGSARTRRGELLHATVSTIVVTGFATSVAAVYALSAGGYSLTVVAFLVVGSLVILVGLGR